MYMYQPPGFYDSSHHDYVCLFQKSLYDLKQAPRSWYHRLLSLLLGSVSHRVIMTLLFLIIGLDILLHIYCFMLMILCLQLRPRLYFSNLLPLSVLNSPWLIWGILIIFLVSPFSAPEPTWFLIKINMFWIFMTGLKWCLATRSHSIQHTSYKLGSSGSLVADPTLYQSLVGALQYLTFTCLDISFVVLQICLYIHGPREPHLHALKHIIHYLWGTMDHSIQLYTSSSRDLIAYSNAEWGNVLYRVDSHLAIVFFWAIISYLGRLNAKLPFLALVLKQNTEVLLMQL